MSAAPSAPTPAPAPTPQADPATRPPAQAQRQAAALARLPGLLVACAGLAILIIAASLDPNPTGIGTHTQLGWSPCGFQNRTGLPCATCGMTTATTLAADARFFDALRVQPAGLLFALASAAAVLVGTWSTATGQSLKPLALALIKPRALIAAGLILAAAWAYRIADAFADHAWTTLS